MIKVELASVSKPEVNKYPYIGQGIISGIIVLFVRPKTGMVLDIGNDDVRFCVGYVNDTWTEDSFKPCGPVLISNV